METHSPFLSSILEGGQFVHHLPRREGVPSESSARNSWDRKRCHYERGLFNGRISQVSNISKFSRISRKWWGYPLFSTVWGFLRISRITKFSRVSRTWTFLKGCLSKKTPFSEPETSNQFPLSLGAKQCAQAEHERFESGPHGSSETCTLPAE